MDIFTNKQSKKLKTYVEKVTELVLKEKLRLHQSTGMEPTETAIPFTNAEISSLWAKNEDWQGACSKYFGRE